MATLRTPFERPLRAALSVQETRREGTVAITVHGNLDENTIADFRDPLLDAVDSGNEVIVDLRACDFVDSSVIAALVVAHQTMQRYGPALRLVLRLDSQPIRVLKITGLYSHLPVFFTVEAALRDARAALVASNGNGPGSPPR
jgi:anti-anti-sigma factor